jgi:RNA polymerase sigma-70 factor (ECF subfamily)
VQPHLYSYILSLVPNVEIASDILQETNLVLWRKADEFVPGLNFFTWACRVAHFQVLADRRDRRRDRHLFDDDLLKEVAESAEPHVAQFQQQQAALERCLGKLAAKDRELIDARYAPGGSVQIIAAQLHKTANAVSRSLYRIRLLLQQCMDRSMHREGSA